MYLTVLVCLIVEVAMTMGGIDGYVLTFTFIPIALVMCEMVDIPRRCIGGLMVLNCAFMACPGAPQVDNIIARSAILGEVFGEESAFAEIATQANYSISSTAAPIPGLVGVAIIVLGGYFYLCRQINKAKANGEHFEWGPVARIEAEEKKLPGFFVSFIPLIVVFFLYTLVPIIFKTEVQISVALGSGIVIALLLFGKNLPKRREKKERSVISRIVGVLNDGSNSYPGALMSLCTPAALAGVITATAAFGIVVEALSGLQIHPFVLTLIVVCVLVAITSSPPAALMIALPIALNIMLAKGFSAAEVLELSPGIMRIGALATTTFETLPFNGLIILTLNMIGCTHKEAYKPMLIQSVVFTLLGSIAATIILVLFPGLA
ncbi:MAG: hypothetical protein LIO96_08640 [Lachnospiraceae bacterium]|nr:hypothetical protein [Lachnospiraceae bacterium]